MAGSPHYRELLLILNEGGIEYLIVGAYAVMKYTEPRYTKDLDVWVGNSPENSQRLYLALAKFGAPLHNDGVTPETFAKRQVVYQIGVAPVRIDISTHIDGVDFETAWSRRASGTIFGVPVSFLSLEDLLANKKAAGRTNDLDDLERLRR